MFFLTWLCLLVSLVNVSYGQYEIPPVILEAYQPRGFRASIKATPDTELFAFHGRLNEKIKETEPGDFNEDVKTPVDGYFTYYNTDLKLKVGDVVNYWIFVQHHKLGYRRDAQVWKVTALGVPQEDCSPSVTSISDRTRVCRNMTIFEDEFNGLQLNSTKWIVEQYVPEAPDYEFVVYRQTENVILLSDNQLTIKPELATEKDIEADPLDLSEGCTKPDLKSEFCVHKKFKMQNPIVSGRLVSKQSFSYADVEVRAKLPHGDWIYPEIYLEDDTQQRLVIAYARGNKVLTGTDNVDIGGSLLLGGPVLEHIEPKRSEKLSSTRSQLGPFSDDFHTYRLRWTKDSIELYVDGKNYGRTNAESIKSSGFLGDFPKQVRLVLGVGVGGISDFPDGYKSGEHEKPWKDRKPLQVKLFYASRSTWLPTWANAGKLQVEYVKVTAI